MNYAARAFEAHRENRLGEAVTYYRHLLSEQPAVAEGWLAFGMLGHEKLGDLTGALQYYRRAAAIMPEMSQTKLQIGTVLCQLDRPREAITLLRDIIAHDENPSPLAYSELACAHFRLKNFAEAQAVADAYLKRNPDHFFAYYMASWAAAACGNLNEAVRYSTDAVALDPGMPMPLALRGMLFWQLGMVGPFRQTLQEMAALNAEKINSSWEEERRLEANRRWREIRREAKDRLGLSQNHQVNFIILSAGLGDQFAFASLLAAFKREFPHLPLVAISPPNAKWETLFPGAADLFLFHEPETLAMCMGISRFSPDFPYTPFFPWLGPLVSLYTVRQLTTFLMGLPQGVQESVPASSAEARRKSEELFRARGGKPGRSVLVSSVSNSNPMASNQWWIDLVDHLTRAGFAVFQNVTNMLKPDPVARLSTAIPVELPLEQVVSFCELAGHFIGTRSGLCDLVAISNVRKKAVHIKARYHRNERYPLSVVLDYASGYSLRRAYETDRWSDIEWENGMAFDPAVIADWLEAADGQAPTDAACDAQ